MAPYCFAREAALYSCFDYLSDNSIIILDDAMRNNYEKVFINNCILFMIKIYKLIFIR